MDRNATNSREASPATETRPAAFADDQPAAADSRGKPAGLTATDFIWHNGQMIAWREATIHVISHVVNYGSSLFEGLRCYATPQGPAIFRLRDHLRRLLQSAKVYRFDETGFTLEQLETACVELIRVNRLQQAYLRPILLRGAGNMGVLARGNPIELFIAAWPWGSYFGHAEAPERGIAIGVSSWRRPALDTLPMLAKASANYMNSQLIKMEAAANGYDEAIALDTQGLISEGPGENIFLVHNGRLLTPPLSSSVLAGITRDCVLRLAEELRVPVEERGLPREMLYLANELFFCGTAVEITPITSVDRLRVGDGQCGPVTRAIQRRFFALTRGEAEDVYAWRTPVPAATA